MAAKGLFFILDGLGDRPVPVLDGQTPLEAASTPTLDRLAGSGAWGLVTPIPDGQKAHTHIGVGSLFGLKPGDVSTLARGPIEMAGLGWEQEEGDIAMRANLAQLESVPGGFRVLDRRAGRITSGVEELAAALQDLDLGDGVSASFRGTEQHRGVMRLSGPGLSAALSDTDPGNVELPVMLPACRPRSDDPAAEHAAALVNRLTVLAHERLQDHPVNLERARRGLRPANGLIFRGAGGRVDFASARASNSSATAVVAGCSTVLGLGRLFGFTIYTSERFTGAADTDLEGKLDAAQQALRTHDMVYVHVKAPDIFGHERDAIGKRLFLERFDRALSGVALNGLVVAVSTDHGTNSNTGWHVDDPVPSLVSGPATQPGARQVNFGESTCADGPLGMLSGSALLQRMREQMGAA